MLYYNDLTFWIILIFIQPAIKLMYLVGVLHAEYPKWLQGVLPRRWRNVFLKLLVRYKGAEIS